MHTCSDTIGDNTMCLLQVHQLCLEVQTLKTQQSAAHRSFTAVALQMCQQGAHARCVLQLQQAQALPLHELPSSDPVMLSLEQANNNTSACKSSRGRMANKQRQRQKFRQRHRHFQSQK